MSSVLDSVGQMASLVTGRQSQHLEVPGTDSAALLSVSAHHISEKMGEPVIATILVSHPQAISRRDYLNQEASFSLVSDDGITRKWSGFISSFSKLKMTNDFVSYEIVLKSHLARLQGIRDTKIYQHKTIPQILEAILVRHKLKPHQYIFRLRGKYPQTLFRFQYAQDDLAYLQMLMTKWGIYLYVEETQYGDRIVFADDIDHYIYDPERVVPYRENAGLEAAIESVFELACHTHVVPQAMVVADYNPDKAWERFRAEENIAPQDPTTYGKPYFYGTAHLDQAEGQRKAQLYHEEAICWQVVFEGQSNVQELRCGRVFHTDTALPDAEDGLVAIEVTHRGARDKAYSNTFKAIPANRRFRLKIDESKWPKIAGTLSGRVTSPDKYKYAYLTAAGCYTNRFDVDFEDWPKGGESVPLRLAKPFAGALQTGFHFPAVDNTEVVVGFRDGDPDKPELLGFHHNSQAVDHITNDRRWLSRNVIRTQSNNKLRMEDWAGEEGIKLSTEHSGKSQLNLGHLVDSDLKQRGAGYELRSDGHGALRAGAGMLVSTDKQERAEGKQLDVTAAMNQLQIVNAQADGLAQAAAVAKAEIADLKAENQWLKNSVNELREAVMLVSSPKGIAMATPDRVSIGAGKDVNVATSASFNVSVLKNVVVAATDALSLFAQKLGIKIYSARGPVRIQAQSDAMELVSQQNMQLCSAAGTLTANAANGVVLSGGGSAYIKVQGDNVEIGGAGNLILKIIEIMKDGPGSLTLPKPKFDQLDINSDEKFVVCDNITGRPLVNKPYKITLGNGQFVEGKTNAQGETSLSMNDIAQGMKLMLPHKKGA